MTQLLKGKPVSDQILSIVSIACDKSGVRPGLAVVQVGQVEASTLYVNRKIEACKRLGFESQCIRLSEDVSPEHLRSEIDLLNRESHIHGILVQLPLPLHLKVDEVIHWIDPAKDVDGIHPENMGKLASGLPCLAPPCTPAGIMVLLGAYDIPIEGRNVGVLGRSRIVGIPLVLMLSQADATVFWAHRKSVHHERRASQMDILVSATGVPGLVTRAWVNDSMVVIDVGTTRVGTKVVGDVDRESVEGHIKALTPVPGGVGPLTIAMLMRNVASLALHTPIDCSEIRI
jgi:methylenetetrahydrofolate dehydrogenase (NADP+)/methenyltetrahydrofolate cyclohydrolase